MVARRARRRSGATGRPTNDGASGGSGSSAPPSRPAEPDAFIPAQFRATGRKCRSVRSRCWLTSRNPCRDGRYHHQRSNPCRFRNRAPCRAPRRGRRRCELGRTAARPAPVGPPKPRMVMRVDCAPSVVKRCRRDRNADHLVRGHQQQRPFECGSSRDRDSGGLRSMLLRGHADPDIRRAIDWSGRYASATSSRRMPESHISLSGPASAASIQLAIQTRSALSHICRTRCLRTKPAGARVVHLSWHVVVHTVGTVTCRRLELPTHDILVADGCQRRITSTSATE